MTEFTRRALGRDVHLLQAARDLGAELLWGRYSSSCLSVLHQQWLNCGSAFQVLPDQSFGDEPSRVLWGRQDQIVMENLFQATLEGVMESARACSSWNRWIRRRVPDIGRGLRTETRGAFRRRDSPGPAEERVRLQNSFSLTRVICRRR